MRKLRTKSLLGIIVTTMVMPFFSCKKEEAKVEESLQINFDSDSYTLEVGKTKQINLTYTPSTKKLSFIYGSTDENVLTVDNTGLMKGELKGKCKVFAYYDANENNSYDDGEVRKEADVKVVNNPSISNKKENVVFYSDYAASLNTGEGGQGDSSLTLPDERFNHLNVDIYNIDVEGEIPYIKLEDYAIARAVRQKSRAPVLDLASQQAVNAPLHGQRIRRRLLEPAHVLVPCQEIVPFFCPRLQPI